MHRLRGGVLGLALMAAVPCPAQWAELFNKKNLDGWVVIGDGLLYGIGRIWGPRLLEVPLFKKRLLPPERLHDIERNFHKYGVKILLFARLLPGIRSPIFITAGIMRLPLTSFLLADGIYAIPGVSLLYFLGYWFTDQFMEIVQRVESVRPLIVLAVLVAVGSYLVYHFLHRPVVTGDPKEVLAEGIVNRIGLEGADPSAEKHDEKAPASLASPTAPTSNNSVPSLADAASSGSHERSKPV